MKLVSTKMSSQDDGESRHLGNFDALVADESDVTCGIK